MRLSKETIYLGIIILVSAYFRLNSLDYMEFKYDEAYAAYHAMQFYTGEEFPLVGLKSSMGAFNPPAFIYFTALPILVSKSPVAIAAFIALLNIGAVYLCYRFSKKLFGMNAAFMASLLFAVNPWANLFSRKIWAQDMLPFFVMLFMISLWKILEEKDSRWIIPIFIVLGILLHLHMSSIVFVFMLIAAFFMYRPKLQWKKVVLGIIALAILFVPYIAYDLKNDFYNMKQFSAYTGRESAYSMESFVFPFTLATTYGLEYSLGRSYGTFNAERLHLDFLNWPVIFFIAVGMIYIAFSKGRRIILLWLLLPSVFLIIQKSEALIHYFILTYPAQFILLAKGLEQTKDFIKNRAKNDAVKTGLSYAAAVIFILILISQSVFTFQFQDFIKNSAKIDGDYGIPYKYRVDGLRNVISSKPAEEWPKDPVNVYIMKYVLMDEK